MARLIRATRRFWTRCRGCSAIEFSASGFWRHTHSPAPPPDHTKGAVPPRRPSSLVLLRPRARRRSA